MTEIATITATVTLDLLPTEGQTPAAAAAEFQKLFTEYLQERESPFRTDYGLGTWGGYEGPFVTAVKVEFPVTLQCDMRAECAQEITHLDDKGFIYCTDHGLQRREYRPCRKLRPHELNRLKAGQQITRY